MDPENMTQATPPGMPTNNTPPQTGTRSLSNPLTRNQNPVDMQFAGGRPDTPGNVITTTTGTTRTVRDAAAESPDYRTPYYSMPAPSKPAMDQKQMFLILGGLALLYYFATRK